MNLLEAAPSLSPSVALRPEPFGALAYHFGNRRLTFLKRRDLVDVVRALDGSRSLREVLQLCNIPKVQWPVFSEAIERLVDSEMILIPEGAIHGR